MKHEIYEAFANAIVRLASCSPHAGKMFQHLDVVVNPAAGGFARRRKLTPALEIAVRRADEHPSADVLPHALHLTQYPFHGRVIGHELLDAIRSDETPRLIVIAGGDGTHSEVMSALVGLPHELSRRFHVFRVPMGSGNDGADAFDIEAACTALFGASQAVLAPAVRVSATGLEPMYSFNVASLGIDAFITGTVNKLKKVVPGDAYKVPADLATLFYGPVFGVGEMTVSLGPAGDPVEVLSDRFILVAFGASGYRTYGDHKRILPGDENVCAIRTDTLVKRIALKSRIYSGEHTSDPLVVMRKSDRIEVGYNRKIAVQCDGEAVWLRPENFPVVFERLDHSVPAIHAKS